MDNVFYVYQYLSASGTPYYIGKGKGNRIHVTHKHVELPPRDRRIIIQDNMSESDAKTLEGELISKFKRKIDGGILENIKINQWACYTGWKHSNETIDKIRQGNLGKVRTEEHKVKYRQPKSESHASNIKHAVANLWANPEYKLQRMKKVMETRKRNGWSK